MREERARGRYTLIAMRRASNRCPRCRATVSQFAAGCALCGADLELLRRRPGARLARAIRTSPIPYLSRNLAADTVLTALLMAMTLFAPLFGMGLALLVGWDRAHRGHRTMRNIAAICFLVALAVFFTPVVPGIPRVAPVWHGH